MKVSFIGLGYVGLTTAICMSVKGFKVVGIDIDGAKIEKIMAGKTPFKEQGLEKLLKLALREKKFRCSTQYSEINGSDVVFITVGTPSKDDGSIDLSYVVEAAEDVGRVLVDSSKPRVIVVKSTVVPGTTRTYVKQAIEQRSGKAVGRDLYLCVNPEFLREGSAVKDTLKPDRIVIGEDGDIGSRVLSKLYRRFYGKRMPPLIMTNTVNAEMIKYASNIFLAARISLVNELANICQLLPGADISVVAKGVGLDKRIGPYFLNAGLGYGGSCFPKDTRALISFAKSLGYTPLMLESVEKINNAQPLRAVEMVKKIAGELRGKKAAILGLAFKPGTDDIREAVSLKIIDRLLDGGCKITAYDPAAVNNARKIYGERIKYAESPIECIKDADFCILVTEWDEFKRLRPIDFKKFMKRPLVIDGRRLYNPEIFSDEIIYAAVGLGPRLT